MYKGIKNISKHVKLKTYTLKRACFIQPMEEALIKKKLTPREIEVCAYLFLDNSVNDIAHKMNVSQPNCSHKLKSIRKKLKLKSTLQLALYLQQEALKHCST